MRDNPTARASYGDDVLARHLGMHLLWGGFFHRVAPSHLGAFHRGCLVAVACAAEPGACVGAAVDTRTPELSSETDGAAALRFQAAYARHDTPCAHWHCGPVAVEPGLQGLGLGTAVMRGLHGFLDDQRGAGWLETDKPENVRFYTALGWEVRDTDNVLGTELWFLWRPPAVAEG
jgi:GNAT superfamily N-acetyltransferase